MTSCASCAHIGRSVARARVYGGVARMSGQGVFAGRTRQVEEPSKGGMLTIILYYELRINNIYALVVGSPPTVHALSPSSPRFSGLGDEVRS